MHLCRNSYTRINNPGASPPNKSVLIKVPFVDPAIFNNVDKSPISKATLKTKGSAGPPGLDSDGWWNFLVSKTLAIVARI